MPMAGRQLDRLWQCIAGCHHTGGEALQVGENKQHGEGAEDLYSCSPEHRDVHYRVNSWGTRIMAADKRR